MFSDLSPVEGLQKMVLGMEAEVRRLENQEKFYRQEIDKLFEQRLEVCKRIDEYVKTIARLED